MSFRMILCTRPECQTSAGCKCVVPGDRLVPRERSSLSDYSDDEIAREHHYRMLKKLGDPRICVGAPAPKRAPAYRLTIAGNEWMR